MFFSILSTICRIYLHCFILFEFWIKRHDVIQYKYHLNILDLFHLFENMSTTIFFLFRLFWLRIDTRIFGKHIIFLWYCTQAFQIGLKIPNTCTCVDIQIKGWILKVNTFNRYGFQSSFKISHICTKRREVFHRPQKNRIII